MGEDAVNNFGDQIKEGISSSTVGLIVMISLLLVTVLIAVGDFVSFDRLEIRPCIILTSSVVITHIACVLLLFVGGTGAYSVYDTYHSIDTPTDTSVQSLGMLVTTRLEVQQTLFSSYYTEKSINDANLSVSTKSYDMTEYNATDIDFNAIVDNCDSIEAARTAAAFSNTEPTKKNEYTGLFKDCNLITICAESFSPYVIDPELTPTLYKLANEGIVFNNFYSSYESITTNGEYSFCLGMFPDLSRTKKDNSFIASSENSLPYALGNMFSSSGVDTYAYHNFLGTYYSRNETHPNMGYQVFKTPDNGLDIAPTWPSSDYEMLVESVDDYINSGKQFHAYYMTFSGHYQYNWANIMCTRNRSAVKDLNYPVSVKAYLSCNLELEKALTYLMQRLEEAGIADKTVIVLTTDHYPYGLNETEYNLLAGKAIDTDFEKYKNSFICWKGGMEEPIRSDKICSTIDILPTLLNLFGFEYDSRLIPGKDALSEGDGIAILADQSFICNDYRFCAPKNTLTVTGATPSDEDVENSKEYVKNILNISKSILNTNFYQYITEDQNG